jgi:membrane protease YdiL (CAAX protease family)
MKSLLKRSVQFKGYKWGLTTLLLFPILIMLVHAINYGARGIEIPITDMVRNEAWMIPVSFLMGLLIGGPLGEEFGWRGYALPKLQKRFGGWLSAMILGAIWGLWHIPAFFIEGPPQNTLPIGAFLVTDLLFTFIIAFQQNHSKGSLVPAFLLHGLMNLTMETMPLVTESGDGSAWWIANTVLGIVCIFILILTRPRDFSGRISLGPAVIKQDPELIPTPNGKGKAIIQT